MEKQANELCRMKNTFAKDSGGKMSPESVCSNSSRFTDDALDLLVLFREIRHSLEQS